MTKEVTGEKRKIAEPPVLLPTSILLVRGTSAPVDRILATSSRLSQQSASNIASSHLHLYSFDR